MDKRERIYVGVPHMGTIKAEQGINYLQWASDNRFSILIRQFSHIRPIDVARNTIVEEFLKTDCKYLLMIDSDMSGPANLLELSLFDKDVIGALCFMIKEEGILPTVHERYGDGYRIVQSLAANQLVECDATGTGCIMIRRDIFDKIEKPYFEYVLEPDGKLALGQDYNFCMKVKTAGYKIFVHTGYITSHDQIVDITKQYLRMLKVKTANDGWGNRKVIKHGDIYIGS